MPGSFEPSALREQLLGDVGYQFDLDSPFDEADEVGGVASSAHAFLNKGVACLLVDLVEPAELLLVKARDWLRIAIDKGERPRRYFPDGTESERFSDLALLSWLLDNRHDADSLEQCITHAERLMAGPDGRDRASVELSVVDYVDAGHLEEALRLVKRAGIRRPQSVKGIATEGQLVYHLAQHGIDSEEGRTTVKIFLDRTMEDWLARGHYARVARWTKILYWSRGASGLAPIDALWKCYGHVHRTRSDSRNSGK